MDQLDTIDRAPADLAFEDVCASDRANSVEHLTLPIAPPVTPSHSVADHLPRRFAGFTYAQLIAGLLVLAAAVWGMWATSRILALENRRVVSVRLAAIVNDFVTAEARSGTPPEQLAARTRSFMTALDTVLKFRAANGEVVLVGEAVVASSVPDVTNDVVADLAKIVKLAAPAAMPPSIAPSSSALAPTSNSLLAPDAGSAPTADPTANPFDTSSPPAQPVQQP